jgi:hypothetical protein
MEHKYRKNYGIFVGIFDEEEMDKGIHDIKIDEMQQKYPKYQFINWIETKKNHKRAMRIYICELKDLKLRMF